MLNPHVSFSLLMMCSVICLCVITFFVCKLLISLTTLSNNANVIANSIQNEVEPTLKELKEAAKSINSIANSADSKFKNAKGNLLSLMGATACFGGKVKSFMQGIAKGVSFGLNLFKK